MKPHTKLARSRHMALAQRFAAVYAASLLIFSSSVRAQNTDALFRRGVALMEASRPAEAEEVLRSVSDRDRLHTESRVLLGFLYLQRAALREAEESFARVLELRPDHAPARLGLAMVWAHGGMIQRAAQQFQTLLEDPSFGDKARLHWIRSLFVQGKDDEALRQARDLVQRYPSIADYHAMLGFLHQTRGNNNEALQAYLRAVELEPQKPGGYFSLLAISKARQDWNSVLAWIERGLELDRNHPLFYQEMAFALKKLGRTAEAAAAETEAQRTYDAEVLYLRAVRFRNAGNQQEAEAALRRCLELNPRLSKAWGELGELLRQGGQLEDARRAFTSALETNPENALAHLGLAATFQAEGKDAEAESAFRRGLLRGLKLPDLHTGLAATYLEQGKAREAAAEMLKAIGNLPNHPDLLSYMGYIREARGETVEALAAYSEALQMNPRQEAALLGEGHLALKRGDFARATARFRRATEVNPSSSEAWHGLIRSYRQAGDAHNAELACHDCLARTKVSAQCREELAFIRLDASDYKESAQQFQRLLNGGRSSKAILDALAFCRLKEGQYEQSIGLFERSLKNYGADPWIHSSLGYLYRLQGNIHSALAHYRRACETAPGDAEKNHDLGFALYLARDYGAAVQPFEAALRLRPDWGLPHYNLAMTYWNLGSHALAVAHARSAHELGVREAGLIIRSLAGYLSSAVSQRTGFNRRRPSSSLRH